MIVGGSTPSTSDITVNAASTAPAAVRVWPIMDLLELTASFVLCAPNTLSRPKCSILSFSGVPVPWALI